MPLFAVEYKQQGTTEKRAEQAEKRKEETETPWDRLLAYYESKDRAPLSFLLLASQRRTDMDIGEVGAEVGIDPWEALAAARAAELRLSGRQFAKRFNEFLDGFDDLEGREQATTVQDGFAMTYEEIGLRLGISWQRVQQIEQGALAKLRKNPRALKLLMEA